MITELSKFAFCKVSISPIRADKRDSSEMISQLLFGEPIEILGFEYPWVKIQSFVDGYMGFVDHKQIIPISEKELKQWINEMVRESLPESIIETPWGNQRISSASYVSEEIVFNIGKSKFKRTSKYGSINLNIFEFSKVYLNSPYLWGGKSIYGIDCSGLTQSVFGVFGIKLPRDAYQQEEVGTFVSFEERQVGDLAFFGNQEGKIIHVGIIGHNNQIIHASGFVKIDEIQKDGIYSLNDNSKTHNLHSIKRFQ